jgi:hypothetical protein
VKNVLWATALFGAVGLLLAVAPRSGGAQWVKVIRAEIVAQVNGPSMDVEVALSDGRTGWFEIGFSQAFVESGDVLCVTWVENLIGRLTLDHAPDSACAGAPRV